jgi:hypothetical protein
MSFAKLEAFEKKVQAAREAALESDKVRALKKAVLGVIPKGIKKPKRPKGRTAVGGLSKREVAEIKARAVAYLDGDEGLEALQSEVQRTAIVILLIDGIMGTEPWRGSGSPYGAAIAPAARLRYLDAASRILDDLKRSRGRGGDDETSNLLEGVVDAEVVK